MTSKRKKSSVEEQIDENLKRVYDTALNEDLPPKFAELIAKLKSGEAPKDGE